MMDIKNIKNLWKKKTKPTNDLIRADALRKLVQEGNGDIDPNALLSMYLPHRKQKKLAASLLRIDKLQLILLALLLIIASLFIIAFMQEKMGNFTINLNRLELYRRGISIADNGNFENATAKLTANTVQDATNISANDIPNNVSMLEGSNNGKNYMAYTYYIRNAGKETVDYIAQIHLENSSKGAEEAVRVEVLRNDESIVYALPSADGTAENGCENFYSDDIVCNYTVSDFYVGNVDKYTVVIWLEGDDPECVDKIIGGSVEFSMYIDADMNEKENLFTWFVEDVVDFITGDNPIDAAGTDAPEYAYTNNEITYATRRNQ